ncbi:MAG: hypothetical protein HQ574_00225 [Chloroflexi bacterium]|nr:hypothetical protein [Chloroflexota bacterium]
MHIDDEIYTIVEHPNAAGVAYGQEGRQAIVYQLVNKEELKAIKVFKPRFRTPSLGSLADNIKQYSELPGLRVCERVVLTPHRHLSLLRPNPDLIYAVLMPWVVGSTWTEILSDGEPFSPQRSLNLATHFSTILATLEQRGLAHCDLSGANLIISQEFVLELVDVEGIYAPGLPQPEIIPAGSPGYAHREAPNGLWSARADRFAGAVLIAEMLGWCDARICDAAWGESYFNPSEMGQECERYDGLAEVLSQTWGNQIAGLFRQSWGSAALSECPTLGEWMLALPEQVPEPKAPLKSREFGEDGTDNHDMSAILLELGQRLQNNDNIAGAVEVYRHAQKLLPKASEQAIDLAFLIQGLEKNANSQTGNLVVALAQGEKSRDNFTSMLLSEPSIEQIFEEGLSAFQQDGWQAAKELLGEVVRREEDYERFGWKTRKLLAAAEERLITPWKRLLRYTGRILFSSALVLCLVSTFFVGAYLTLARPVVEDSIFLVLETMLNETDPGYRKLGCTTVDEEDINDALASVAPNSFSDTLVIQLANGEINVASEIGGRPVWIKAEPTAINDISETFKVDNVELSWMLHLIFSPNDLRNFVNKYFNEEILLDGRILLDSININDGEMEVCTSSAKSQ